MTGQAMPFGPPDGFYVPAEEHAHARTFMQWPVNRTVHPDRWFLEDLQGAIARLANTIATFEPVVMLMAPEHVAKARRRLSGDIDIWDIPTDDLWARDSGPLFVIGEEGELAICSLNFNGWGNKQVHVNDGRIARQVANRLGLRVFDSGLVGEPGGVESDGDGTLIAQESCWVNPNRNTLTRPEIEARLLAAYGAEKMIWAPGLPGSDITDDHIDALARFAAPGQILFQVPPDGDDDPFSVSARTTYDILSRATDAKGRRLELTEVPTPHAPRVRSHDFVASYVNYYVCNGGVVAAEFGDPETDAEAEAILRETYPDREIVMLNVDPIGEVGGGIHCATQQQPAVS
ncbi:MAG: agmatine deiminase family protein [Roseibium sp.]|nr:agmatine deiminase family protein [Roseibium sp.]